MKQLLERYGWLSALFAIIFFIAMWFPLVNLWETKYLIAKVESKFIVTDFRTEEYCSNIEYGIIIKRNGNIDSLRVTNFEYKKIKIGNIEKIKYSERKLMNVWLFFIFLGGLSISLIIGLTYVFHSFK